MAARCPAGQRSISLCSSSIVACSRSLPFVSIQRRQARHCTKKYQYSASATSRRSSTTFAVPSVARGSSLGRRQRVSMSRAADCFPQTPSARASAAISYLSWPSGSLRRSCDIHAIRLRSKLANLTTVDDPGVRRTRHPGFALDLKGVRSVMLNANPERVQPVQARQIDQAPKKGKLSRTVFAVLAGLFAFGIVVQVFLAGVALMDD